MHRTGRSFIFLERSGIGSLTSARKRLERGQPITSYSTWTELLPNQPTQQGAGLSVNPGDDIQVEVWIGDGSGPPNQNGIYGSFRLTDVTQSQSVRINTPLSGTHFNGSEAEWIMERPTVGGVYSELSDYSFATMTNATACTTTSKWKNYNAIQNRHIMMYEEYNPQPDNNLLSNPGEYGTGAMYSIGSTSNETIAKQNLGGARARRQDSL